MYVRIDDLGPETFQIPPAAHAVVNYPEGAEAFLENTGNPGRQRHRLPPLRPPA